MPVATWGRLDLGPHKGGQGNSQDRAEGLPEGGGWITVF